jgi:hypothetical protein
VLVVVLCSTALLSAVATAADAFTDVTVTPRAQHHKIFRSSITLRVWRHSPHGHAISWRESHNICSAVNPSGAYRGKWQMTRSLWVGYGGRKFARVPDRATCREQDIVARRIWVHSWWWPWGG